MHQDLIGVQVHQPIAAGGIEGHVARVSERPRPLPLDDVRSKGPRDLDRRVGGTRVHDHDLVDHPRHRPQALRQRLLLIAHDHAQAQPQPLGCSRLPGDLDRASRQLGQRGAQRRTARGARALPPSRGQLGEVARHIFELRVQPFRGVEHRFGSIDAPQLVQDHARVVEQQRLVGLAFEHLQDTRGEPDEQRRSTSGREPRAHREPQLGQALAEPIALMRVLDRRSVLEQPPVAVEIVRAQQPLRAPQQLIGRCGTVLRD